MSNPIKVFSQVYVGLKAQYHREGEEAPPPLGFLTPYEENAAGKKRIETVNNWATPQDHYRWDPVSMKQYLFKKGEALPAKILDNIALEGFEICREVKRTGWNGGNVVWRILDPRGFELEISSANMAKILTFATIEAGLIKGKCIWGRLGAANLLMPEGCPEFANIIPKAEEFKKAKVVKERMLPNSEISVGDHILMHNGSKGLYLGKWNILVNKDYESIGGKVLIRHLIGDDEGEIRAISELRVMEVLKNRTSPLDWILKANSTEQELNKIKEFGAYGTADSIKPKLVSKDKIDLNKVKISLQQFDLKTFMDHVRNFPAQTGNHFGNLFRILDFKKTKTHCDHKNLLVFAKLKNGQYFTPDTVEVSQVRNKIWEKIDSTSRVDVWPINAVSPVEGSAGSVAIPVRGDKSYLGRTGPSRYTSPQEYFSYSFGYNGDVGLTKNFIVKFFEDNVEEILYYEVSFEKPNGELVTNVYYN